MNRGPRMNNIEFFMPMIPPTKTFQDKVIRKTKSGKAIIHDSTEVGVIKRKFLGHLNRHKIEKPLEGALRFIAKWIYPIGDENVKHGDYKITKPDIDNMQKLLLDCMTKLKFWEDDCQIASLIAEKFHGDIPGIYIKIEKLGDGK